MARPYENLIIIMHQNMDLHMFCNMLILQTTLEKLDSMFNYCAFDNELSMGKLWLCSHTQTNVMFCTMKLAKVDWNGK
mgnify:CR=1 FL=1